MGSGIKARTGYRSIDLSCEKCYAVQEEHHSIKTGKPPSKMLSRCLRIEDQLEKYLTTYEQKMPRPGTPFKEKKSEIDPKQLYIVAFVQDDATRRILQSTIAKVKR